MKIFDNVYMKRFIYFNLYVIKGIDGDILIDTGFIGMKRNLKKWLDKFNIKLVILTHAHADHVWNTLDIKKWYNCEVAIGSLDFDNVGKFIDTIPSKSNYNLWTKLMHFGMKKFIPKKFDIDILLSDNDKISKYGIELDIISLPGHTNGSIGIKYNNYLFVGDALVNRNKRVEIAYQNQDNDKANSSYERIIKINPKIIFLGHDKEIINDYYLKEKL